MNMRIVKNSDGINGKVLGNGLFLEKEIRESEHENVKALKYYIYNLETNSKTEILPKVKKYDLGEVFNININSKYVYFFSHCRNQTGLKISERQHLCRNQ